MPQPAASSVIVFIDTNIALHYKRLDQIDWKQHCDSKRVQIVVCSVFLAELEKHKVDHSSKKIRKRAGDYSIWLSERFEDPILSDGVDIRFLPDEPMINFKENRLDPTNFDDRLVASVIELSQQQPESILCVMTADLGLTLKLKTRGLRVVAPLDKHKLSEELSEEEKENRELRLQVSRLNNRLPRPTLLFNTNQVSLVITQNLLPSKDEFLNKKMCAIHSKYHRTQGDSMEDQLIAMKSSPIALQIGRSVRACYEPME